MLKVKRIIHSTIPTQKQSTLGLKFKEIVILGGGEEEGNSC